MEVRALAVAGSAPADSTHAIGALRSACGHVRLADARLLDNGYRFFAMPAASEVPSFLVKRFQAGGRTCAVSLVGGLDPETGDDTLAGCRSAEDARSELAAGRGGSWQLKLTWGAQTITLWELSGELARREPSLLAAFTRELERLDALQADGCGLCRHARAA